MVVRSEECRRLERQDDWLICCWLEGQIGYAAGYAIPPRSSCSSKTCTENLPPSTAQKNAFWKKKAETEKEAEKSKQTNTKTLKKKCVIAILRADWAWDRPILTGSNTQT